MLQSLEMCLISTKNQVALKLEGYANQNGYDPNESFLNFYVLEEALKSGNPDLLNDEQIVRIYSDLLTKANTSVVLRNI